MTGDDTRVEPRVGRVSVYRWVMRLALLGTLTFSLVLAACFDPAGGRGGGETTEGSSGPGATDAGPATCVPGQLQVCACPDGSGNQVCNAEGTAYGPCECPSSTTSGPSETTGSSSGSTGEAGTTTAEDSTGPGATTQGEESGTSMGLGETGSSSGGPPPGPLDIGESCTDDTDCMTLVCWDFSDYDALCFGTACSVNCASDDQCFAAMSAAGAPDPSASTCGVDGRCTTLGTGFGAYACASPS